MLIISKNHQKDYYDYIAQQHGRDKEVVFRRVPSDITFPSIKHTYAVKRVAGVPIGGIVLSKKIKRPEVSSITFVPFVIVVGDFYLTAVKIIMCNKIGVTKDTFFIYTEDELSKFLEENTTVENNVTAKYDEENSYFFNKYSYWNSDFSSNISKFFKCGPRPKWVPQECIVGYGPYNYEYDLVKKEPYVGNDDGISLNTRQFLMNHWKLKDVKLSTVMSPENAYTHIYNYIQNSKIPKMIEISNESKIIKGGFDLKQSFRHRK